MLDISDLSGLLSERCGIMAFVREYIFSVTGAALVSGVILRLLAGKGSTAVLGKMLVGIFMALTVLNPIVNVTLPDLMDVVPNLSADAQTVVAQGEAATQNALAAGISKQVEAYILDRAEELGRQHGRSCLQMRHNHP